jgi:hypothetical protein
LFFGLKFCFAPMQTLSRPNRLGVILNTGTGTTINSLDVDFQTEAQCNNAGKHWLEDQPEQGEYSCLYISKPE